MLVGQAEYSQVQIASLSLAMTIDFKVTSLRGRGTRRKPAWLRSQTGPPDHSSRAGPPERAFGQAISMRHYMYDMTLGDHSLSKMITARYFF